MRSLPCFAALLALCALAACAPERELADTGTGEDARAVALHELAHSIGLQHSADPASIMFKFQERGKTPTAQDFETANTAFANYPWHRCFNLSHLPASLRASVIEAQLIWNVGMSEPVFSDGAHCQDVVQMAPTPAGDVAYTAFENGSVAIAFSPTVDWK